MEPGGSMPHSQGLSSIIIKICTCLLNILDTCTAVKNHVIWIIGLNWLYESYAIEKLDVINNKLYILDEKLWKKIPSKKISANQSMSTMSTVWSQWESDISSSTC